TPRALPAFPTRRSSDLPWQAGIARQRIFAPLPPERAAGVNVEVLGDYRAALPDVMAESRPRSSRIQIDGRVWIGGMGYTLAVIRSEEHTSELQLRSDIV